MRYMYRGLASWGLSVLGIVFVCPALACLLKDPDFLSIKVIRCTLCNLQLRLLGFTGPV